MHSASRTERPLPQCLLHREGGKKDDRVLPEEGDELSWAVGGGWRWCRPPLAVRTAQGATQGCVCGRTVGHATVAIAVQPFDDLVEVLVFQILGAIHVPHQLLYLILRPAGPAGQWRDAPPGNGNRRRRMPCAHPLELAGSVEVEHVEREGDQREHVEATVVPAAHHEFAKINLTRLVLICSAKHVGAGHAKGRVMLPPPLRGAATGPHP